MITLPNTIVKNVFVKGIFNPVIKIIPQTEKPIAYINHYRIEIR